MKKTPKNIKPKKKWMQCAIRCAREGIKKAAGGPFGACVVRGNRIIAAAHNTVLKKRDATCHAEINAIREASRKLKRFDLSDCVIYSTTEPCPMCFAAIHWSRIAAVFYGTKIQDVAARGFNELSITNRIMKKCGKSQLEIRSAFLYKECQKLLLDWDRQKTKQIY